MAFLEDYYKLVRSSPMPFRCGGRNQNADFTDYVWASKNAYFCFDSGRLVDSGYIYKSTNLRDCYDCSYCVDSELCYECFVAYKCYNSSFLEYCLKLTDCHFCIHCRFCDHCFGCIELQYKQYCLFNVQYTKLDYEKKINKLKKLSSAQVLKMVKKLQASLPQAWMRVTRKSEKSFGDYVLDCKNCYFCFNTDRCEDCAYLFDSRLSKDSFDCFGLHKSELCYECHELGHAYNCSFINIGDYLQDCHFCTNCYNSQSLFGCVNQKGVKYKILNRQYSKAAYFARIDVLKKSLKYY